MRRCIMMHPGKKYSLHLNDNRNTVILSHVVVCIYGSYVYMIQKSSQTVHKTQLRFQDVVGHVPCLLLFADLCQGWSWRWLPRARKKRPAPPCSLAPTRKARAARANGKLWSSQKWSKNHQVFIFVHNCSYFITGKSEIKLICATCLITAI